MVKILKFLYKEPDFGILKFIFLEYGVFINK